MAKKGILMSECEVFKLSFIFAVVCGLWYLKVLDVKNFKIAMSIIINVKILMSVCEFESLEEYMPFKCGNSLKSITKSLNYDIQKIGICNDVVLVMHEMMQW